MFNLFNTAPAAPQFNLKPIEFYFTDPKAQGLLSAALEGDMAKTQNWVAQGANPNQASANPYNQIHLLHYAVAAENANAIRLLASLGADPELVAKNFGTASDFAITLEKPAMLDVLLEIKPFAVLSDQSRRYLLFDAAKKNSTECLELLLQRGFPIDITDSLGNTALMDVLAAFDFDRAEWLINHGANVLVETRIGATPANDIQDHLSRVKPGSESEQKLLKLKTLMEARGVVFPVPTPQENRARKAR